MLEVQKDEEERDEEIKVVDTLAPLPDGEMTLNLLIHSLLPLLPSVKLLCPVPRPSQAHTGLEDGKYKKVTVILNDVLTHLAHVFYIYA